jgi:hypothetical protein
LSTWWRISPLWLTLRLIDKRTRASGIDYAMSPTSSV